MERNSTPRHERRKHPRLKTARDVFVFLQSNSNKLGEIIDISRGGLSFRYLVEGKSISGGPHQVDIMVGRNAFWIPGLKMTTVADRQDPSTPPSSMLETRIAALRFADLSQEQNSQLSRLLILLEKQNRESSSRA